MMLAFQSPLSILRLKYAENNNKDAIKKTYRQAILHCHPDKTNYNPVIPTTYYDLLNEARD
jgi:hypothetical protein